MPDRALIEAAKRQFPPRVRPRKHGKVIQKPVGQLKK